ncbi:MAG: branched-chain amino acid ABC transporter permease [Chloroflexota bacterium]|nr:branched-chain amino acid ABC transporter permease [Chloroflexota bacterium]MDE3192457.1 branched-chain amino acid ABC transporter permease [Chloroflexota bacterium]
MNALLLLIVVVVALLLLTRVWGRGPGYFAQILVYGFANGSIYALIAIGYTMVYGIIELINFAHGDVFTLGGFVALALLPMFGVTESQRDTPGVILPLLATLVISMLFCGVVNVLIERIAYRPLRHAPRLAPLITAVGMSFVLEGIMFLWRGPFFLHFPDLLPSARISIGPETSVGVKELTVFAIAIVLTVVLSLFIERTKLGKAMRATAQDRDAAQLMGIDINTTIALTFFIGAALAGAGGMIFGLYFNSLSFDLGFSAGLFAFTAAVFGGIGNIYGAAIGGLVIGMVQSFSDGYFDSTWTQVVIFAVLILVLVFRPTGILGMRVPEK